MSKYGSDIPDNDLSGHNKNAKRWISSFMKVA